METKISIVIASYLGPYKGAARDRDIKIFRALDSVFSQTYENFECLLVSDGCEKTRKVYEQILIENKYDNRLRYLEVNRYGTWGGNPRNAGIDKATGEIIVYLDIDDYWQSWHLDHIAKHFGDFEFVYFDDYVLGSNFELNKPRKTLLAISRCGTSSIAHRKNIKTRWPVVGNYAHDWKFIESLTRECKKRAYIGQGGYCVAHIPQQYDV